MAPRAASLDLAEARRRLGAASGLEHWRSLDEFCQTEELVELLQREMPALASEWTDPVSRRRFLTLMGASLALAGLSGCTYAPGDQIVPYIKAPEEIVAGKPLYYATAMPLAGYARGLIVENHMGRPIKVEGNPDHPASPRPAASPEQSRFGPTDLFAQAALLTFYDPDRSQTVTHLGNIRDWDTFVIALRGALEGARGQLARQGEGLRILTETVTSPTLAHQLRLLKQRLPRAGWHTYEPAGAESEHAGARLAFGRPLATQYRFDKANAILALDADFLTTGPACVRYARDFSDRRRVRADQKPPRMNRLYVVESTPSGTGARADHRWPLRAAEVEDFARAVAARLDERLKPVAAAPPRSLPAGWIDAVVDDLKANKWKSIVLAGPQQPPVVHALAHAMNVVLGNVGETVIHTDPVEYRPGEAITPATAAHDPTASLRALTRDMAAGKVEVLIILGGNPAYTAPVDLPFADLLAKVKLRVHLGLYQDETAVLCHWHVPETHFLEAWSDARAFDGTVSIIQPLIAPLYGSKTPHELLAVLTGQQERSALEIVRSYWKGHGLTLTAPFDDWWNKALHDGLIARTALKPVDVSLKEGWASELPKMENRRPTDLEIVFRPDPAVFDGRFANNAWLQELPRPLTRLVWDNAALVSPRTAAQHGLANEDVVELSYEGRKVNAPVWIVPGHANGSVTIHLGYGRTRAGKVGTNVGFNAYALRTSRAPWIGTGLTLRKADGTHRLACTQHHHLIEGRHLIRSATLEKYKQDPAFAQKVERSPLKSLTLYNPDEHKNDGYQWGMVIDLAACTGCNACVVACQAENNIPVVGKSEALNQRAMHWLRIDAFYQGGLDNPETFFQPVPCMQCENAPCEVVCPVEATVHSSEGLNDMVYNRCVGTRYCSNNCPYKVRRFNFFQYADGNTPSLKLMHNPEVTVRSRGVMEKCTYCVQRINRARIEAEKDGAEGRPIRDGEVVTACQGACPAGAIVFGDLSNRGSVVSRLKEEPRNYALLAELNTRPRTTYLASLKNPNSRIAAP